MYLGFRHVIFPSLAVVLSFILIVNKVFVGSPFQYYFLLGSCLITAILMTITYDALTIRRCWC